MKILLFLLISISFYSPALKAQEPKMTLASFNSNQPTNQSAAFASTYYGHRDRTPGTIGMIVGGSLIVIAAGVYAATANKSEGEAFFYAYAIGFPGAVTLGISGLVFGLSKMGYGPPRRFSVYSHKDQVGLAYNF